MVAQWRVKVHAARKRVILVVWGMIRFKSTIKMRSRLRRVDTWGYMIPSLLGPGARQQGLTGCRCLSLDKGGWGRREEDHGHGRTCTKWMQYTV